MPGLADSKPKLFQSSVPLLFLLTKEASVMFSVLQGLSVKIFRGVVAGSYFSLFHRLVKLWHRKSVCTLAWIFDLVKSVDFCVRVSVCVAHTTSVSLYKSSRSAW